MVSWRGFEGVFGAVVGDWGRFGEGGGIDGRRGTWLLVWVMVRAWGLGIGGFLGLGRGWGIDLMERVQGVEYMEGVFKFLGIERCLNGRYGMESSNTLASY